MNANIDTANPIRSWLACVYETVDAVLDGPEGNVPPGTAGRLHRAIDALKAASPDDHYVARAEAMSLTVHRLEWALLDRRDGAAAQSLREQLRLMGREWIEATPLFH
jgi:hypothetical protein